MPIALAAVCGMAFVMSGLVPPGRDGWAFGMSALGIVAAVAALWTALFPG